MKNIKNHRREFLFGLSSVLGILGLAKAFSPETAFANTAAKDLELPLAKPGEGTAGALKYVEDKKKVEKSLQTVRAGKTFEQQSCKNCMFYQSVGTHPKTKGEVGKCQVLPGSLVVAGGWCNSWTIKP